MLPEAEKQALFKLVSEIAIDDIVWLGHDGDMYMYYDVLANDATMCDQSDGRLLYASTQWVGYVFSSRIVKTTDEA